VAEKIWCVAELDEEYIRRMEDVLKLYERLLSEEEPGEDQLHSKLL
jgi:hypothetical protein